ncbi:MAG: hypothetical protein ACFFD8_02595 [Candidatus Thorarchaeota archaeon]
MVVHAVWIIDTSGIPLYHKAYSPLEFDPTLFSSFFSSLVHFQSEMMGRQLQDITFEDLSFSYIVDRGLVFLASVKKDATTGKLLESLRDVFLRYFKDDLILLSTLLRTSPKARKLLQEFEAEVDSLVGYAPHKEPVPVRVSSLPRLLHKDSSIRQDILRRFGMNAILVIILSDGNHRIEDISEALDLPQKEVQEIIRHADRRGYVKIVSAYKVEEPSPESYFPEP